MGNLLDTLGGKAEGQLIRSSDWNALVAAVDQLQAAFSEFQTKVEQDFGEVKGQVDDLSQQVGDLKGSFDALAGRVESLVGQYYRVTLSTTRARYATGEMAEITAQVTDLEGGQLELTAQTRPWIDFVATWGRLKPVAGFDSLGGVDDRTLSVRTNQNGVARVNVRVEDVDGITEEAEDEVGATLATTLPSNKNLAETILEATTPMEAKSKGAFQMLTEAYDRTDAVSMRSYVDAYYVRNADRITGRLMPVFTQRWRDYRTTVVAYVKNDSLPTTPDPARGVSSIQVTFRDWIGPWIVGDYFVETGSLVQDVRDRLTPKVTDDMAESFLNLKDEVSDFVLDKGLVGKQRNYRVVSEALDRLVLPRPPAFLNKLTKAVQDAASIQQVLGGVQGTSAGGPSRDVAFEVFTDAATRADTDVAGVKGQVAALQEQVGQVEENFASITNDVSNLKGSVGTLGGRLDATLTEGGQLQVLRQNLDTVSQQVRVLRDLDPSSVREKMLLVDSLSNRVEHLERGG